MAVTDSAARGESMGRMTRFEHIYRQNFPFVWAAAHRCGVPDEAVDDVVQDVFLAAHRRLDELDWEVSARGWLYAVTRNLASKHRRARTRRRSRELDIALRKEGRSHPHRRHDAARTALALLARIDEGQREVFIQAELLGMTAPEIAADLGLPLNTVYSRVRLARRRLAALAGDEASTRRAVDALLERQRPTARDERRNAAALAGRVGFGWGALVSSVTSLGPALVGIAALGVVAAAVWPAQSSPPVRPREVVAAEPSPPPRNDVRAEPPTPPREEPLARAAVVTSPPRDASRSRRPKRQREARPAPVERTESSLSAEVALLDRARDAHRRGDSAVALRLLETYDARFPDGQLRGAASAVRSRVRCAMGGDGEECSGAVTESGGPGEP